MPADVCKVKRIPVVHDCGRVEYHVPIDDDGTVRFEACRCLRCAPSEHAEMRSQLRVLCGFAALTFTAWCSQITGAFYQEPAVSSVFGRGHLAGVLAAATVITALFAVLTWFDVRRLSKEPRALFP